MRSSRPISAPMVALVSAGLHAGLAILFVPALSFVFLLTTHGAATDAGSSETWMTVAVIAPLVFGVIGLVAGLCMAFFFNLFAKQQVKAKGADEPGRTRMAVVSVGDAA